MVMWNTTTPRTKAPQTSTLAPNWTASAVPAPAASAAPHPSAKNASHETAMGQPIAIALEERVERIPQDIPGIALHQLGATRRVDLHHVPAQMRPEEALDRAVRIALLVRKLVVAAVDRDPIGRRVHE